MSKKKKEKSQFPKVAIISTGVENYLVLKGEAFFPGMYGDHVSGSDQARRFLSERGIEVSSLEDAIWRRLYCKFSVWNDDVGRQRGFALFNRRSYNCFPVMVLDHDGKLVESVTDINALRYPERKKERPHWYPTPSERDRRRNGSTETGLFDHE